MFTGIVEETGTVERIEPAPKSIRLTVRSRVCARGLKVGNSLAVNGCCLTVVRLATARPAGKRVQFDLLRETWERTNLQFAVPGSRVNLERALPADGRLGGHLVSGHIDGLGRITRQQCLGNDLLIEVTPPSALMRYIAFKGSIAVDGISLTVAAVMKRSFRVWIIPHTLEVTALGERGVGDAVNLETDLLAKYVERLLRGAPDQVPIRALRETGHHD